MREESFKNKKIVYFDGVCSLCNGVVDFLIKKDHKMYLSFAPLQGKSAKALLPKKSQNIDSIIFYNEGVVSKKSKAALEIAIHLGGVWKIIGVALKLVPSSLLDVIYDLISKNRYCLFGKSQSCRIPSLAQKKRFLD